MKASRVAVALLAAVAAVPAAPAAAATFMSSVVATGLNNPRGLAFSPTGDLYIAESGVVTVGGPSINIRGNIFYYSETGSITRVAGGVQERIVTGLPSLGSLTIPETTGPADIVFGSGGTAFVVLGLGADPSLRSSALAPNGVKLGQIFTFTDAGVANPFADVALYEQTNNPAGGPVDSNPFHAAALADGLLVTDAGSNTLLKVGNDGAVSQVAVFPSRFIAPPPPFSDSVPTGIAVGPDGNYYVAELTGFPFAPGAARIYRVMPDGSFEVAFTGFTNIVDIEFGDDGTLYVLEVDSNGLLAPGGTGRLIEVAADGSRTTLFTDGLVAPTGFDIGPDGAFYVTNFSRSEGSGQVLRIAAIPEPGTWAMLILGFGAAGAAMRTRRRQAVTA